MTSDRAAPGFAYRREQFQQIVEDTLALARQLGASDAGAEVSEGVGLSVSVRKGELENVERNRDKSLGVSVYLGQRRGNGTAPCWRMWPLGLRMLGPKRMVPLVDSQM